MQHRRRGRIFGRKTDRRRAFIKSLVTALVLRRRINTTEARAKELRPRVEKMVTKAKSGTLHARRQLASETSPKTAKILIEKIAPEYKSRSGGYLRIIKTGIRRSDAAKLAIIEFV